MEACCYLLAMSYLSEDIWFGFILLVVSWRNVVYNILILKTTKTRENIS